MADFFEQVVADYLTEKGYVTKLNVNYRKPDGKQSGSDRGGLVCLNSAARFDKWNRAAVH